VKRIFLAAALALLASSGIRADDGDEAQFTLLRPGGFVVFMNSRGPLSYVTLSPGELPADAQRTGVVRCSSCQHGLSIPLGMPTQSRGNVSGTQGNGGFDRALARLKSEQPELRGIYDVKVDLHQIIVLGVYRRLCTEITARGFR
jgi:hypothetical protein